MLDLALLLGWEWTGEAFFPNSVIDYPEPLVCSAQKSFCEEIIL